MSDLEKNKEAAVRFLDTAFEEGRPELAVESYVGAGYRQHNPIVGDGPEGVIALAKEWGSRFPDEAFDHKRVIAEGEYVVVHTEASGFDVSGAVRPDGDYPTYAVVDIFRFDEDGKIVEHWDVIQEVPEQAVHDNGMF
jgi:predicted SnoaL-like aldol condensation-catalyzing enzyme